MREIINFPGYFLDETGNVFRKKKTGEFRPIKPKLDIDGYRCFTPRKEGKTFHRKVAPLMLETFIGERPLNFQAAHGINGIADDSISNLSWKSTSDNNKDKLRDGTIQRGSKNNCVKLTETNIFEIRNLLLSEPQWKIAEKFNVTQATICLISQGKTWSWLK